MQEVYKRILNLRDPSEADVEKLSGSLKVGREVVVTVLNHAMTGPSVRAELREMGYVDEQIPDWLAQEKK